MEKHTDKISNKCPKITGVLNRLKLIFPQEIKCLLLGHEPGPKNHLRFHLGGQRIVVFLDLLDISSQRFSMITTAYW